MIVGLLAPSAADLDKSSGKRAEEEESSGEGRTTRALRRKIRRVYDPWRWRLWAAALLAFGISALVGLLARP